VQETDDTEFCYSSEYRVLKLHRPQGNSALHFGFSSNKLLLILPSKACNLHDWTWSLDHFASRQ